MKTLVIHPADKTTDYLKIIYANQDWTIINSPIEKAEIKELVGSHERIICLGHGLPQGLIGFGDLFITSEVAKYLKNKKECVFIWCNADQFVKKYKLTGLCTGMIISEKLEANLHHIKTNKDEIEESNQLFAETVRRNIDLNPAQMLSNMQHEYKSSTNPVIHFNSQRIFNYSEGTKLANI